MKPLILFALLIGPFSLLIADEKSEETVLPAKILFLGDSITYSGQYVAYVEAFVRLKNPECRSSFLNLGLPSETLSGLSEPGHAGGQFPRPDLHERLDRVLNAIGPDLVFACYGMNCGIYHPYSEERFRAFQDGVYRLRTKCERAGSKLIHLTPPVFDPLPIGNRTAPSGRAAYAGKMYDGYDEVLDLYSAWLIANAASGWKVVDTHNPMHGYLQDRRIKEPHYTMAPDGVHANEQGHWILAKAILVHLGIADATRLPDGLEEALTVFSDKPELMGLIRKKQRILSDAWLTRTGHLRPGMARVSSLDAALMEASELEQEIQTFLNQPNPVNHRNDSESPGPSK